MMLLDFEKAKYWLAVGAQPSDTVLALLGKVNRSCSDQCRLAFCRSSQWGLSSAKQQRARKPVHKVVGSSKRAFILCTCTAEQRLLSSLPGMSVCLHVAVEICLDFGLLRGVKGKAICCPASLLVDNRMRKLMVSGGG